MENLKCDPGGGLGWCGRIIHVYSFNKGLYSSHYTKHNLNCMDIHMRKSDTIEE